MEKEVKKNEKMARMGNKNSKKFKNKADFERVFNDYLQHLRAGKSKYYFPETDYRTIDTYISEQKDCDLLREKVSEAEREGFAYIENLALETASGEKMGNSSMIMFILKNKLKEQYKDKTEVETSGTEKITISFVD